MTPSTVSNWRRAGCCRPPTRTTCPSSSPCSSGAARPPATAGSWPRWRQFPARHLADIVDPAPGQWSWIVDRDPGTVVGVASLFRTGLRTAEVGLLVEDAEQRHGFGTGLLDLMVATALDVGVTTLQATTLASSHHVRRMLGRVGTLTLVTRGTEYEVQVSLARPEW